MSTLRVAVIGAGGSGLPVCRYLKDEPEISHVVYEAANGIGGIWRYTKNEKNGINTAMYKNLRTNLPKEVMPYPDFPFPKHLPSFISKDEVAQYLRDYAAHFNLMKYIKLEHEVLSVKPIFGVDEEKEQPTWEVVVKNVKNNTIHVNVFDAVVVGNGHFTVPRRPEIPGLKEFSGIVIHSVDYDKPEDYKDQAIAILGAKSSGVDICMDLSKFATKIYLIHLGEKTGATYPENVEEIIGTITACSSEGYVEISNGEKRRVDGVILCTGYLYSFPFLDPECGIDVSNNRVTPLYKHVFNIKYPSMAFIGICKRLCPFPNFGLQAQWICAVLAGKKTLPSQEEMLQDEEADYQQRLRAGIAANAMHTLGEEYQLSYNEMIAELAGVPCTYTPCMYSLYFHVHRLRAPYVATYKSRNFTIDGDTWKEVVNEDWQCKQNELNT